MIKIITDDGADVPVKYVEQYNLDILDVYKRQKLSIVEASYGIK